MTDEAPDAPQIYLASPPDFELSRFPGQLAACLDAVDVACVRLALVSNDEGRLSRAADALREVTHARDVALVIDTHVPLAERLGLDGVHLLDGARSVRAARKALGDDAIVGAACGTSRHDGLSAGEHGADYVSFGPMSGAGETATLDLFQWWSQMIEVPVVAEGGLGDSEIATFAPYTDFFALSEEIWRADDPAARLTQIVAAISGGLS